MNGMQIPAYLWMVFWVFWLLAALRIKRASERVDLVHRFYYTLPVALGYYLMFGREVDVPWFEYRFVPRTTPMAVAAIVVTIAGMAFAVWARVYLGSNWSSAPQIKEKHELIRSGPYRLVRHPIYTGILLAMAGTALANGKVRGALAVVLCWMGWEIKYRMEEKFMAQAFGAEYEDYRRSTAALFPRLAANPIRDCQGSAGNSGSRPIELRHS